MKPAVIIIVFVISLTLGLINSHEFDLKPLVTEIKREHKEFIKAVAKLNQPIKTWSDFIAKGASIAKRYDMPPAVLLGQAALESGHGTSPRAVNQNNYFGLAVYEDYSTGLDFSTPEASIEYYARLISHNPLYAHAYSLRHNPYKMIQAIKDAGYATDPYYVDKVINTPEFKQFAN